MKILSLTPPMSQLNTPYPATAYLTGYLRSLGFAAEQRDLSIELACGIFSASGLRQLAQVAKASQASMRSEAVGFFLEALPDYLRVADRVLLFLQGKDQSLAHLIAARRLLPEGPKFCAALEEISAAQGQGFDPLAEAFGKLGHIDQAKYYASLYINDLTHYVQEIVDPHFGLSRYAESLAASQTTFDPLYERLGGQELNLIDAILQKLVKEKLEHIKPNVLLVTVPFPGNVYGAFRVAQFTKRLNPRVVCVLGGGYVNTELRELDDPRVFEFFDAITYDDGEAPLKCLLKKIQDHGYDMAALKQSPEGLKRTRIAVINDDCKKTVLYVNDAQDHDVPQKLLPAPTYDGLDLGQYLSLTEVLNPMHRLWSNGHWNKLTVAHGCYWKKCSFCDTTLDYIGRYEMSPATRLVDAMETLIAETGHTGFHFVDEAAPPAALKAMAEEIMRRGITVTWWGNVRFEKSFTPELCELLAESGCIALTGGLEVADDRLLKLIDKGVTVEQVSRVTAAMTKAGIMVHAYLMYGFPTQTAAETKRSLERVRKLFAQGSIQSAYWHRFSVTAHSAVGQNPEKYGIRIKEQSVSLGRRFARNDLPFEDLSGVDHGMFTQGLNKAVYNYMHGLALDEPVSSWL
jgi:radical SAM superfamily enzyme YgiQ (UPF0313 family)